MELYPVQLPIRWQFLMHHAGLTKISYLTHAAALHSTATVLGGRYCSLSPRAPTSRDVAAAAALKAVRRAGLFEDVSDSYPLQLNPDYPTALCTVNITFVVVKGLSGSTASFTSQSTGGSASSSSSYCSSSDGSGCSGDISADVVASPDKGGNCSSLKHSAPESQYAIR